WLRLGLGSNSHQRRPAVEGSMGSSRRFPITRGGLLERGEGDRFPQSRSRRSGRAVLCSNCKAHLAPRIKPFSPSVSPLIRTVSAPSSQSYGITGQKENYFPVASPPVRLRSGIPVQV